MSESGPFRTHNLVLSMSPSASETLVTEVRQGYLAHKKHPQPPLDRHRALGIVLLQGPRGALFFMSEVPMQRSDARLLRRSSDGMFGTHTRPAKVLDEDFTNIR